MADGRIVARIDALLRKAESSEFPEERDAFLAKAAVLMRRHAIDQGTIDEHRADREPPGHETWVYATERDHLDGKRLLLTLVCEMVGSGTRGGFLPEGRNGEQLCVIYGFPTERTVARLTYLSLVNMVRDEAHRRGITGPSTLSTFTVGYVTALFDRLRDERLAAAASDGGSTALVLADRSAEVEAITPDAPDIDIDTERMDPAVRARGYAAGQFADVDLGGRRRLGPER